MGDILPLKLYYRVGSLMTNLLCGEFSYSKINPRVQCKRQHGLRKTGNIHHITRTSHNNNTRTLNCSSNPPKDTVIVKSGVCFIAFGVAFGVEFGVWAVWDGGDNVFCIE